MTVVECEKELESSNSFSEGEGLEEQFDRWLEGDVLCPWSSRGLHGV
jgi:hypothetical protein